MTTLIQQAEALDDRACEHEASAKNLTVAAEKCRAEAAKLRERAAREPLRLWVNAGGGMNPSVFTAEADARYNASMARDRIAVPMVEVRPVRITDKQEKAAYAAYREVLNHAPYTTLAGIRAVMEYALSLAGVEVES